MIATKSNIWWVEAGTAEVYLAFDPLLKREVAIKLLLPSLAGDDVQFEHWFEKEAQLIAALDSSYITPIYDFGRYTDRPYFVMAYMSGGSLQRRLASGPLSLSTLAEITSRVAQALDVAHQHHIIHRDLKPANILFNAQGEAFLSDFGIARIVQTSATQASSGILGTPAYMSPEQVGGAKDLDGRTDIYSLGVTLFQGLTGELPYQADTPIALALQHLNAPVPSLLKSRPDLPSGCETVLKKALAKDRTQRFGTAGELASALNQLADGKTVALDLEVMDEAATQLSQRHDLPVKGRVLPLKYWYLISMGALLLIAIASIAVFRPAIFSLEPPLTEPPLTEATPIESNIIEPSATATILVALANTPTPTTQPTVPTVWARSGSIVGWAVVACEVKCMSIIFKFRLIDFLSLQTYNYGLGLINNIGSKRYNNRGKFFDEYPLNR